MMKRDDAKGIHIRKVSRPEMFHNENHCALGLSHRPGKTIKNILWDLDAVVPKQGIHFS